MDIVLVTGSGGLVGSEAVRYYAASADLVVGIDNDMRAKFFGDHASTAWSVSQLRTQFGNYRHFAIDIRDQAAVDAVFEQFRNEIKLIIHTAAQPSHDWSAIDPVTDFTVNANGTLAMLEACRRYSPSAVFILTSTNKVYGDRPNTLPLVELDKRWEIDRSHPFAEYGIDESMSIDRSTHSPFGASKVAADIVTQEYGRYFGLKTGVFRGGCLTGPAHSGTKLHGFLAYLMKCTVEGTKYTVFGYEGKQVRDNIHSHDLIRAFDAFYRSPRPGEVYNIGGSRYSNCSMIEAIELCERISGRTLDWKYEENNRVGDHIWYVSDVSRFRAHYPDWSLTYDVPLILQDIFDHASERWT